MRLENWQRIIKKNGTVQDVFIHVDYEPSDDSFELLDIEIWQNGGLACEISELLDKVEGNPSAGMVEAIDWRENYRNSEHYEPEESDYETGDLIDRGNWDR